MVLERLEPQRKNMKTSTENVLFQNLCDLSDTIYAGLTGALCLFDATFAFEQSVGDPLHKMK